MDTQSTARKRLLQLAAMEHPPHWINELVSGMSTESVVRSHAISKIGEQIGPQSDRNESMTGSNQLPIPAPRTNPFVHRDCGLGSLSLARQADMSQPPLLLQWDLRSYLQYREELHPSDEGHLDKEAEELIGVYHFYNGSGFSNDKDTDEVAHLMRQHFNEFGYYLPKGAIDILKDKEGTVHRNMLSKIEKGLLALRDLVGGEQMSAASQQERMQLFGRLFDQSPRDVCNFIFTEWGMLIHFDAIFSLYEPPEHTRSRYMPINKQMCLQRFTRFRFCHMLEMVYMCKWVSKKDDRKTLYRLWRAGVSDEAVAPLREVFGGVENLPLRSHWARRRPTWAPPVTSRVEVPAGEYDVPD